MNILSYSWDIVHVKVENSYASFARLKLKLDTPIGNNVSYNLTLPDTTENVFSTFPRTRLTTSFMPGKDIFSSYGLTDLSNYTKNVSGNVSFTLAVQRYSDSGNRYSQFLVGSYYLTFSAYTTFPSVKGITIAPIILIYSIDDDAYLSGGGYIPQDKPGALYINRDAPTNIFGLRLDDNIYTADYSLFTFTGYTTNTIYAIYVKNDSDSLKSIIIDDSHNIANAVITLDKYYWIYTGDYITPAVTVEMDSSVLTELEDYIKTYQNNLNADDPNTGVLVAGVGEYSGSQTVQFYIIPGLLTDCVATLEKYIYDYTGSEITPIPKVYNNITKEQLVENVDYTLSYLNNIEVGSGTIVITGIGLYANTPNPMELPFEIVVNEDPYGPGGVNDAQGGDGDYNDSSDPVDFPTLPSIGAMTSKFITLYTPTLAQIQNLASYMWSSAFDLENLKKLFVNPMECIIGLSVVPVPVSHTTSTVVLGNIDTGVSMDKALVQYVAVDCGSVELREFWGSYLDYSPYTKVSIYLPYIGFRDLLTDDVMNSTLSLKYYIDLVSGACIAAIKTTGSLRDSVTYQFSGQCSAQIPISGNTWNNAIMGAVTIAASTIGAIATEGASSVATGLSGAASAAVNMVKPEIHRSGSLSSTASLLAVQTPYLVVNRPRQALPGDQNNFQGYPAFLTRTLSTLNGYTEVETIHLDNIPCTEAELNEISTLLKEGVML